MGKCQENKANGRKIRGLKNGKKQGKIMHKSNMRKWQGNMASGGKRYRYTKYCKCYKSNAFREI